MCLDKFKKKSFSKKNKLLLLFLLSFLKIINLANGLQAIGASLEDDTIQFPHETCRSELHGKYDFSTFHKAEPFFDEEGTFEMLIRFKGVADGHMALTVKNNTNEPLYVIIIGSYNNKITEIRRTKAATPAAKVNTPEVLTPAQWRGFEIRYSVKSGNLSIFPEGFDHPLLEWRDSKPLQIAYFSFTTYTGRVLQVAYDCRASDMFSSVPKVAGGKTSIKFVCYIR